MPHRWKASNRGCLKVQQSNKRSGKKAKIVGPGDIIPPEFVGDELLARFGDQIEEVEKVVKPASKPTPKPKGEKK